MIKLSNSSNSQPWSKFIINIPAGGNTNSFTVNHNLGVRAVDVRYFIRNWNISAIEMDSMLVPHDFTYGPNSGIYHECTNANSINIRIVDCFYNQSRNTNVEVWIRPLE